MLNDTLLCYGVLSYLEYKDILNVLCVYRVPFPTRLEKWRDGWTNREKLNEEFFVAVQKCNLPYIEYLVSLGIKDNINRALCYSIYHNKIELVEFLISNGANINTNNNYPLRTSARNGYLELVDILLRHKCKLDIAALHWSAKNGYFNIVKLLAENGIDIRANKEGALIVSASGGHLNIVKYLVGLGCNINVKGDLPLRVSAENGQAHIIDYILKNNSSSTNGIKYAFINSIKSGKLEVVELLFNKIEDMRNVTAIKEEALLISALRGYFDILKYLIDNSSEYTYKSYQRALRESIRFGNIIVAEYLNSMNVVLTKNEYTEELIFSSIPKLEVIKYLFKKGANLHADNEILLRTTARYCFSNKEIIKFLVEHKANINVDNGYVIKQCVEYCDLELLKFLVERGACVICCSGKIVQDLYKSGKKHKLEMAKYLEKHGAVRFFPNKNLSKN